MSLQSWSSDLSAYFVYILFVATLGPLLFGFHLGELNAPEDVIRCKAKGITVNTTTAAPNLPQCIEMSPTQWGVVGSMYTLGGLLGALSAGSVASRYGRLRTMHIMTVFFTIGPMLEALSASIAVMACGRLLSGVGAGAAVVIVPLYISEISPPAQRGLFGAFTQIMCNVGILFAQLLGYFLSHDSAWRYILAAGGVVGIAQALGLLLSVESPKYIAAQGNMALAKKTLRKIRGADADIDGEVDDWNVPGVAQVPATATATATATASEADEEQRLLLDRQDEAGTGRKARQQEDKLSIVQVFCHKDYKRAAIAVMMVMLAQQFSGINSIVMYGVSLLAGLLESNSALLNLAVSALNIVVTAGGAPLVDRLGRKTCLLNSLAGMGISSLLLAIGIIQSMPVLSAVAVVLFVASFGLGLGPVPFILASELVDSDAADATQSIALAANWTATFIVAQFFPLASAKLHGQVYLIFAALSAGFFGFVSYYVPETKGKKNAGEVWGRAKRRVLVD